MNIVRSVSGEKLIMEASLEESKLLVSLVEFISRYRKLHPEKSDCITDEEIEFAEELVDEIDYYITTDIK